MSSDRFPPLHDDEETSPSAVVVGHVICAGIGFLAGIGFALLVIF